MALMRPAPCPPTANAAERAVYAACARFLDAAWAAWFQVPLPGRERPAPRVAVPLRADFVLLGPTGLTVVEVKGWRAAAVRAADDSRVAFRNGATAQHPLVQAYRYAAHLAAWLRTQPGVLQQAPVPLRYAAALPYVTTADLSAAPWAAAFRDPRLLLADALGPLLDARLAALPPPGAAVSMAQRNAVARVLTTAAPAPAADQPALFDE